MNIFQIVDNLYTKKDGRWINELDRDEIQPFVIQRFLLMNDSIREYVRWLDKYVFYLPPNMYLSLAWSVIPKANKAPYVKYIKKEKENEELSFILTKIREHMQMSDNDFSANRDRIVNLIKSDMPGWFRYYGIEKPLWKKYMLDYNYMKLNIKKEKKERQRNLWQF